MTQLADRLGRERGGRRNSRRGSRLPTVCHGREYRGKLSVGVLARYQCGAGEVDAVVFDTNSSELIEEMLDRWEVSLEQGDPVSAESLCQSHPHLLPELQARMDRLRKINRELSSGTIARLSDKVVSPATDVAPSEVRLETVITQLDYLAKGGLGIVYRGYDSRLHRPVAVKFIQRQHLSRPDQVRQFRMEAEITSRLDHPGVVPVHGIAQDSQTAPCYTMRLMEGRTLHEEIEDFHRENPDGPRSRDAIVRFRRMLSRFVGVCQTLAYAHNRGIIHCDLKPANIMLGRFGETIVFDWGLAMYVGRDETARSSGEVSLVPKSDDSASPSSATGGGTPVYMSPEQHTFDAHLTPASDIYSLGATLFRMIAGRTPFDPSTNLMSLRAAVLKGDFPKPRSVRSWIARPLEAICLKAMHLDPAARYDTANALAEDIERFLADEPVSAYQEPTSQRFTRLVRRHRQAAMIGVGSLILLLVGSLGFAAVYAQIAANEHAAFVDAKNTREQSLNTAALFASRYLASEIEGRWQILSSAARDPEAVELLDEIAASANNPQALIRTRRKLNEWLASWKNQADASTPATAWTMLDANGVQQQRVAADGIDKNVGNSFAYRTYFHGGSVDLDPAAFGPGQSPPPEPLAEPHISAVYCTTIEQRMTVTFSVPVKNAAGEVRGVLTMSVAIGEFDALRLPTTADRFAVLVDTRPDWAGKSGLVLAHRHLDDVNQDHLKKSSKAWNPVRVSNDMLETLDEVRTLRVNADRPSAPYTLYGHSDPFSQLDERFSGDWVAAVEPVHVSQMDGSTLDSGWVILVQERPIPIAGQLD